MHTAKAIDEYDHVVQLLPLPQLVGEHGDLLTSAGQPAKASEQYDLSATEQKLFTANGVADHLTSATFDADHGEPARALAADALAWAPHRNGQHTQALSFATIAI